MAKAIFINRYFYPDHSATSQMLSDLAFALAADGREVHVVTGRQLYDNPAADLPASESVQGVRIHRVWTTRFGRGGLPGRAIDYLTFYLSAAWCLLLTTRAHDQVIAKTDPPLISVIAMVVAALRGATLVNWVQDLFPEVAEGLDMKAVCVGAPFLRGLRNISLRAARNNVVLGERMAARLVEQGVAPAAVTIIHNWSDAAAIQPVAARHNPLRAQWGLSDKFVVGYSGNMGRAHEFVTLLDAAHQLREETGIVFLFIGSGIQRAWLEDEVRRRGLKNVLFQPYQPRGQLALSLSVPDLHVISLRPQLEGLIVPSKFYGIAAAGRPTLFIGDPDGEIPRILSAHHCGATAAIGDVGAAVRYIRELAHGRPELNEQQGGNARMAFERRFAQSSAFDAWRCVLGQRVEEVYA